ncbi:50S ribosomal protein L29 [Candidatus Microgenomates bacterium]|nr:50S ribosomal protein L29 [Candidatus Microgenomates bacterium]
MKKKELQELRTKTPAELRTLFAKKKQERARIVLEVRGGKIKNVHAGRTLKRDSAQIATLIREKELQG